MKFSPQVLLGRLLFWSAIVMASVTLMMTIIGLALVPKTPATVSTGTLLLVFSILWVFYGIFQVNMMDDDESMVHHLGPFTLTLFIAGAIHAGVFVSWVYVIGPTFSCGDTPACMIPGTCNPIELKFYTNETLCQIEAVQYVSNLALLSVVFLGLLTLLVMRVVPAMIYPQYWRRIIWSPSNIGAALRGRARERAENDHTAASGTRLVELRGKP